MAKSVHNNVLDGAWDILDQATGLHACNAEPTTRTEAITTFQLASAVLTPNTDFTKADGDTSGRKVTVAAKSGATIDNTGTATHIAITDGSNLLAVTTCTSQGLTAAGTVDFPEFDLEILDPT